MKILHEQSGFIQLEAVLLASIVLSLVAIWASIGIMINQQRNDDYHMVALWLAQGYLNLLEAHRVDLIPDKIQYNNQIYTIKVDESINKQHIRCLKVNVEWKYDEYTEREVLQREIIK